MTARPSLILNFANAPGFLDRRIGLTRASVRTIYDHLGLVKTIPANAPGFHHDPATGESLGLIQERSSTNLLLRSEEISNAAWTKTSASVSADSTTAPDGAITADTLTASGAGGNANQAITITVAQSIALSVFVKPLASNYIWFQVGDGTNTVDCWFNISAGTVGAHSAGASTCTYASATIRALPNGWYRCILTVNTATSTGFTVKIGPAAADNTAPANADSAYLWGAQAEAFGTRAATSYIPTTSATVTRAVESAAITLASSWFNATEGTIFVECATNETPVADSNFAVVLWDGTTSNALSLYKVTGNTTQFLVQSGGVTQASGGSATAWNSTAVHRMALAYKANDFAFSSDGAAVVTDTSGTVPAVTTMQIGRRTTTEVLNGCIRRLIYFPRRISNADLQSLTA